MNCNTTHYRANSSSVPGDPTRYADGGFFNNAIALCNKILRQSPGRASIYYKLGRISAQKGFKNDAKQNYLEYADRMQKAGRMDEAFRALKEFADLCPDQDDIRLMLAEQLSKQERSAEAIEQLQTLYDRYLSEGREVEANATVTRIKAIDPEYQVRATGSQEKQRGPELVFLDVYAAPTATPGSAAPTVDPEPAEFERASDGPALDAGTPASGSLLGLETTSYAPTPSAAQPGLLDFEPTSFGVDTPTEPTMPGGTDAPVGGFEPMTFEGGTPASTTPVDGLDFLVAPDDVAPPRGLTPSDGLSGVEFLSLDDDVQAGTEASVPEISALDVPSDTVAFDEVSSPSLAGLPLMDVDDDDAEYTGVAPGPSDTAAEERIELSEMELEAEPARDAAPFPAARSSAAVAAHSVELLEVTAAADPDDFELRRRLGEARLEAGDRTGGLADLEAAMAGFERDDDLGTAASIADEIARITPDGVRIHQKRVEYAFRLNERPRLVAAYLDLAAALLGDGQTDKARSVYQRVLDLAPDDVAAQAGLAALSAPEVVQAESPEASESDMLGLAGLAGLPAEPPAPRPAAPDRPVRPAPAPEPVADGAFINLGDWLREDEGPKSTRMVVDEEEPSGDEEADFADMLRKFKQGVAQNVDAEDHQSHYDLGVAFKEMGLIDEAIAEFQKALRAPSNRLPTYEALGQCFVEKGQHQVARAILTRALSEQGISDEQLIGVLYLLGQASEQIGAHREALDFYQRVFVVDIQFRDVADRLTAVEQAMR